MSLFKNGPGLRLQQRIDDVRDRFERFGPLFAVLVYVNRIVATTFDHFEELEQAMPCHARHLIDGVDRLRREAC